MSRHWLDNADSYICPNCRFETDNPNKYEGCKCPKCGFQDDNDIEIDYELRDACPHLSCGQCKYFKVNAEFNDVQSTCKRLDHKHFQFAIPWFKSYDCGLFNSTICKDFSPSQAAKYLFEHWNSIDNYFGRDYEPSGLIGICIDSNQKVRYKVRYSDFWNNTFIDKHGELKWVQKTYYKVSRKNPIGYELVTENKNEEDIV